MFNFKQSERTMNIENDDTEYLTKDNSVEISCLTKNGMYYRGWMRPDTFSDEVENFLQGSDNLCIFKDPDEFPSGKTNVICIGKDWGPSCVLEYDCQLIIEEEDKET
jgi:hypothetical protein